MRDILTVLSGLAIVVLAALLAVPPLLDWTAHRAIVDAALSRATGQTVRTDGALDIRLLPSPRIRAERLRIGGSAADEVSLDAMYLRAELALTPLLGGEARFVDARVGRAEIKLPTGAGGDWHVPDRLVAGIDSGRKWVFEDLSVAHLLLTTSDPVTGRTDQAYAQGVRIQAQSLAGPWRLEGSTGGTPFEIAVGELGQDHGASAKIGIGGRGLLRLDVDGRLALEPDGRAGLKPRLAGTAKLVTTSRPDRTGSGADRRSPPPFPLLAQAGIQASGRTADFADLSLEAGEGTSALRLAGRGSYRLDTGRLALALAGRRFDLPAFLAANRASLAGLQAEEAPAFPAPVDLSLRLDSLVLPAGADLSAVRADLALDPGRLRIGRFEAAGPGRSRLGGEGEVALGPQRSGSGRVTVAVPDSDRLAPLLEGTPLAGLAPLLDGRPLEVSADITAADPVLSVRNLRASLGETLLTGILRHTAAEPNGRARLDAQLLLQNLDIASLGDGAPLFRAARDLDLGLSVDARGIGYGTARGGRISGRVVSEGPSLLIERLEVRDLAGAEATLSGRVSPDGTGRVEGRLKAPAAAPLLDLFGRAWLGDLAGLIPSVVRDDAVDLAVRAERPARTGDAAAPLRTVLSGRLAKGPFEATVLTGGGRVQELSVNASTDRADLWLAGGGPGLRRPASLTLAGQRDGEGRMGLSLSGDLAGLRVATARPLRLGPGDTAPDAGALDLASDDASGLLALLVGGPVPAPVPLALTLALAGTDRPRVTLRGQVAGGAVEADLGGPSFAEIDGTATLARLSLPWLASALVLNAPASAAAGPWPGALFGERPAPRLGGTVRVKAATLALGAGWTGRDATLRLAGTADGLVLSELDAALSGGRLRGGLALSRQGGLASIIGEGSVEGLAVGDILGPPFGPGRLAGTLRFGASGGSLAALVSNLGGAGSVTLDGLAIEGADPDAVNRVAGRVIASDDPLASTRWQPLLASELSKAPLAAARTSAGVSLVAGAFRVAPLALRSDRGSWTGSATIDLRTLALDARGTLQAAGQPGRWPGDPPAILVGWSGPLRSPARTSDPAPMVNALAAIVLQRELDRIDNFEIDAAEQGRRKSKDEMDRQRRIAAEEAARLARAREEARLREERERARQAELERVREAERARDLERQKREQDRRETDRRPVEPPPVPPLPQPLDIRPPPAQSGG